MPSNKYEYHRYYLHMDYGAYEASSAIRTKRVTSRAKTQTTWGNIRHSQEKENPIFYLNHLIF